MTEWYVYCKVMHEHYPDAQVFTAEEADAMCEDRTAEDDFDWLCDAETREEALAFYHSKADVWNNNAPDDEIA